MITCKKCKYWDRDYYSAGEMNYCHALNTNTEMFSDEGCSNDLIACTSPDFGCVLGEEKAIVTPKNSKGNQREHYGRDKR